jgi:hypothetical protein
MWARVWTYVLLVRQWERIKKRLFLLILPPSPRWCSCLALAQPYEFLPQHISYLGPEPGSKLAAVSLELMHNEARAKLFESICIAWFRRSEVPHVHCLHLESPACWQVAGAHRHVDTLSKQCLLWCIWARNPVKRSCCCVPVHVTIWLLCASIIVAMMGSKVVERTALVLQWYCSAPTNSLHAYPKALMA